MVYYMASCEAWNWYHDSERPKYTAKAYANRDDAIKALKDEGYTIESEKKPGFWILKGDTFVGSSGYFGDYQLPNRHPYATIIEVEVFDDFSKDDTSDDDDEWVD